MKALWIVALVGTALGGILWIRVMIDMPLRSHTGPLPPLAHDEEVIAGNLRRHVSVLAGTIGERNLSRYDALLEAEAYLSGAFTALGYDVHVQGYTSGGRRVGNLIVEERGSSRPERIVLVGAHYDSVPGCPGANDNASGVAALLEIGRLLKGRPWGSSVRLAAFVNEEPPYFQTEEMGSRVYARQAREEGEQIVAALSLETIGCYFDCPGTQLYPPPFGLLYPDRGNFIAFVGNTASAGLVRRCVATFRRTTAFPSEGIAAPSHVPGIGWSDHWSFWQEGYPALMVTDTAPYRYPHYHTSADTPEQVDYERMSRVVAGLVRVIGALAQGEEP